MPKKQTIKILSLLIAMIMVVGSISSLAHASGNLLTTAKDSLKKEAANKITKEVKEDLKKEELVEVLVYMKDQVDVMRIAKATESALASKLTPYASKMEVRKAVTEALMDKAEMTQGNLIKYLEQEKEKGNVEEFKSYHIVNMLFVKATPEVVENISYMDEVAKIYKNKRHKLEYIVEDVEIGLDSTEPLWNITRVKADQVWDMGIDGTGAVVGILDSGADWTHPALKDKWRGYDPATDRIVDPEKSWFDPQYGVSLPEDSDDHGTHVMGTILGREPDGSNPVGVAPGARWIAARVFDRMGYTTDDILIEAAEWMLHPGGDPTAAPDVVNNSWGGPAGIDDWYRDAVTSWRAAKIFPVFSAGNQRPGEPLPWPGSISNPANYPESYAVAAVDRYDQRASFSKLGPSPYDESLVKPNISAPGVSVISSIPGGYAAYSGTSMSAPHVSGTVALMFSANSSLELDEIESILASTADPLTDSTYPEAPNFGYGHGMVDAFEAVSEVAAGVGVVEGYVLQEGEDLEDVIIIHEQEITEAFAGSEIEIKARLIDDVAVTEAELLVKPEGKSYWFMIPMDRISGDHKDGIYRAVISSDMLIGNSLIYKIKAVDYAKETVVSEDYRIDIKFGILPDEYHQGFESNALGWIFDGCWDWGKATDSDPTPYEGDGFAGTVIGGNYVNSADDWLITPPIDLRDTSLQAASLRFHQWYRLENNYDRGHIYVTKDYGQNWNQVTTITGNSNGWHEMVVNLNDYIGSENPVFVGFRLTSDYSANYEGWYIDNVRLLGPDSVPPQVPSNLRAEAGIAGINLTWTPSPDGDLSHYNIYRAEEADGEFIKVGETAASSYMDTDLEGNKSYYYKINAEDTSGNVSDFTEVVSATATEVVIFYSSDFEEDDGGFITGGSNSCWEWGIPTSGPNAAASGEKVWATNLSGDYYTSSNAYIESPEITIPEDKIPYLSFKHWYHTENNWDYGYVQISDDGENWTNITGKITNVSNGWISEEIAIPEYRGKTIKIRFHFYSDYSVVRSGWYIDDVVVSGIDFVPPTEEVISYDDGVADDAIVLNEAGNGCAVRFTPSLEGKLMGTSIYLWGNDWPSPGGNRLGFEIYRTNEDGSIAKVGDTLYIDDLTRGDWNYIDLSDYEFFTGEDFFISTMQDTIGEFVPGVGLDTNSGHTSRAYLNIAGDMILLEEQGIDGMFMIRAHMDYTQSPPEGDETATSSVSKDLISRKNKDKGISKLFSKEMTKEVEPSFTIERGSKALSKNKYKEVADELVKKIKVSKFTGIPIEEAYVTVLETGRSVKVDPVTGKYSMRLPAGEYTLRAEAYGYYSQDAQVVIEEDGRATSNFLLEAKPRGSISGRVIDRYYKNPAANALIRLVEDPRIPMVMADEDGYFTIPDVLVGEYTLRVVAEGFLAGEFPVEVLADKVTEVELGLERFVGFAEEIAYDDGTAENALVLNNAPNGLAVRFTPTQYGKVKGVNIYFWGNDWPSPGGNRIGFAIYDIDESGKAVKVGDTIFVDDVVRGDWNFIDLSSIGFSTDRDYFISTIQDRAGSYCPGTGIDEASPHGDRSYMNLDGEFELISSEGVQGALMIRAIMEYSVSTPEITNLDEVNYTNEDSILVEGMVTADGKVNIYVNDEKVASGDAENNRFAIEVELPLETNTIMATAEMDGVETEPSKAVTVIKDKEAPVLEVIEPEDNKKMKEEVVHVRGSVVDNVGIEKLLINDVEIEVDEDGNFHKRLLVDQGENLIVIRAVDLAGNERVVERRVIVNLEEPVITNIQPSEDVELKAGDELTVSFEAPTGGKGYFRLLLPMLNRTETIGIPMTEVDGLYSGSWTVPEGVIAKGVEIQVVYISPFGSEVTALAEGRVDIIPEAEEIAITNIQPSQDVELKAGDELTVSFNAPAGGEGYFRLLVPSQNTTESIGIPMTEVDGLYSGSWVVPAGLVGNNLQIEVIYIAENGSRLSEMAEGRVSIVRDIKDLPNNSVIMGSTAFDIEYLNNNEESQLALIEWLNAGNGIYVKIDGIIIDEAGKIVEIDVLADKITHYDRNGNSWVYIK